MEYSFVVIIQARMGSKRFPGKTMYSLKGKPSIYHLLSSVENVFDKNKIFIATSQKIEDNTIYEFCTENKYPVFRGDEENVASRFYDILQNENCDFFIRINADSPLLDYRIIEIALKQCNSQNIDLISSVIHRSLPSGTNIEIVNSKTFKDEYKYFSKDAHFEHVTRYFYENSEKFNNIQLDYSIKDFEKFKFSFDTLEDKLRIEKMFEKFEKPHFFYTLNEKCEIYKELFLSGKS
jgi:spore coat polysaccharide biosynthesis protein SpsF